MEKMMKESFGELYEAFAKSIEEKNEIIRQKLVKSQVGFASKETLSIVVSLCLIEDIETINVLKANGFSDRYTDCIIRMMCEQVIEYIYIMEHTELIPEYFGENIKEEWNGKNLFKGLKSVGSARFKNRKSVSEMSKGIDEKRTDDEKISLYDIYSLKAEAQHHSYFHHMLKVIDCDNDENESQEEWDYILLTYIVTAFMEVYDTCD